MPDDWNQRTDGTDGDDCDYRRPPSFRSTADPDRLQEIFDKAAKDGEVSRLKYGGFGGKLSRGRLNDMDKKIADAKAKSRTLKPLFGTINQIGAKPEAAE